MNEVVEKLPRHALWLVALVDALLAYVYVFITDALMPPPEGPHQTTAYWMTQLWVYALISPIAAVAAWRGVRQVQHAWAGRPRWWRLPIEGMTFALLGVVLILLSGGGLRDFSTR